MNNINLNEGQRIFLGTVRRFAELCPKVDQYRKEMRFYFEHTFQKMRVYVEHTLQKRALSCAGQEKQAPSQEEQKLKERALQDSFLNDLAFTANNFHKAMGKIHTNLQNALKAYRKKIMSNTKTFAGLLSTSMINDEDLKIIQDFADATKPVYEAASIKAEVVKQIIEERAGKKSRTDEDKTIDQYYTCMQEKILSRYHNAYQKMCSLIEDRVKEKDCSKALIDFMENFEKELIKSEDIARDHLGSCKFSEFLQLAIAPIQNLPQQNISLKDAAKTTHDFKPSAYAKLFKNLEETTKIAIGETLSFNNNIAAKPEKLSDAQRLRQNVKRVFKSGIKSLGIAYGIAKKMLRGTVLVRKFKQITKAIAKQRVQKSERCFRRAYHFHKQNARTRHQIFRDSKHQRSHVIKVETAVRV